MHPHACAQDINAHLKESEAVDAAGEEQASERAFKAFVRAVHALQSLDLQGDTLPKVGKLAVALLCTMQAAT